MKIIPFAMKFVDPNLRFSIIPIMKQFVDSIHEEMDYSKESENLKKIKKNMEPYDNVVIPEVHDDYSTKNVLTMEYIPGIKVTNIEELDKKGIDRQKLVIDVSTKSSLQCFCDIPYFMQIHIRAISRSRMMEHWSCMILE